MKVQRVFCEHCGSPCVISKEADGQFDSKTGQPSKMCEIVADEAVENYKAQL